MTDRRRECARDLLALLLLAALAVGFLWRCNLGGKVMLPGDLLLIMEPWKHASRQFPEFQRVSNPILDAVQQSYPWRKFAGEWLRRGQWPLWNPHELSGNPFLANDQSSLFLPETWLHALMPTERALGWATSLYFFLSGALMYWFLRVLALRRAACLLGAVAFMVNGFVIGWVCLPAFRGVSGWLPGMLAAYELALRGPRSLWTAVCGLLIGMQFLAGNLHISLYILMIFAAWAVYRGLSGEGRGSRALDDAHTRDSGRWGWATTALAALALGGLFAAAQLLPVLEFVGMSARSAGGTYADLLKNAIALPNLLTLLMPDILGNPVDYNHWGADLGKVYRAYTETAFYVGVAPVLLVPFALRGRRRLAGFWLGVAAVGALLAVGTNLNAVLYYLVPVFRSLSGIGRAVVLISTAVPVLGALGLHSLLELSARDRAAATRLLAVSALVVGLVGLIAGLWVWSFTGQLERALPGIGGYTLAQVGRFGALLAIAVAGCGLALRHPRVGLALVLAGLAADTYLFVDGFVPAVRPEYLQVRAQAVETMKAPTGRRRILALGADPIRRMAPNTPMIFGLEDIQGSDSLELGTQRRLLTAASSQALGFPQPDPASPLVDLLGVRYVHSSVPLEGIAKLKLVSDADGYLYENTKALPRAFTAPHALAMPFEQALGAVTAPSFRPAEEVVLDAGSILAKVERLDTTQVTVAGHSPNSVTLTGDFRPGQLVVLADSYYPGWRAYQGSDELRIARADYALRAVAPPKPGNAIRFLFVPDTLWVGGFLSLLAAGAMAGMIAAGWRGGRADG